MKRAALFVGINDYIKPLASLTCARRDADTLYGLFLKEYTYGMVDYLHDVNSDEIIKSIEKTMESLTEGDLFFFYFSGHGIEERNNHLLLTSGARQLGDEWHHALSVNKLKYLTQKRGVQSVFVIDSCRESVYHGARSAGVAEQSRGATMKKLVEEEASNAVMLPPVILCSCAGGERAFEIENEGHGIFTLALKECLESKACFTLDEIAQNVTERLKSFISKHNFSGHQTPELYKSPGINPVLWGNPDAAKTVESEVTKTVSEDDRRLERAYGKLYAKAEVLVENGRFAWKDEFKQRLDECERIFEAGLMQDAIDALNDIFDWHETQKHSKTDVFNPVKELTAEEKRKAQEKHDAEMKLFDAAMQKIEKKWEENKETKKQPAAEATQKQPEAEKKLSWGQRIWGFLTDYVLTLILLFLLAAALTDKTAVGIQITFACFYVAVLFARKHWYFVLCNLAMGTFCLSLFNSGWWWFACAPVALVVFICIAMDEIPAKIKRCRFFCIYLSLLQVACIGIGGGSSRLILGMLCGSLFFPLIYSFPKTVSWLTVLACGVLAVIWTGWWWIGVLIFLVVLFFIWCSQDEKKKKSESNVAAQK